MFGLHIWHKRHKPYAGSILNGLITEDIFSFGVQAFRSIVDALRIASIPSIPHI